MPPIPAGRPLLPALLDRLSRAAGPPGARRAATVDDLRAWVLRDLVDLLNSRRGTSTLPAPLDQSLLAFGLPDLTLARLDEAAARERLRAAIADAIARFEPRLFDVRVAVEPAPAGALRLRFRIEALLRVAPAPQPFAAEPLLDLPTRSFALRVDDLPAA